MLRSVRTSAYRARGFAEHFWINEHITNNPFRVTIRAKIFETFEVHPDNERLSCAYTLDGETLCTALIPTWRVYTVRISLLS